MDRKIRLLVEELEEKIAPDMLGSTLTVDVNLDPNAGIDDPEISTPVDSNAEAADGADGVTVE